MNINVDLYENNQSIKFINFANINTLIAMQNFFKYSAEKFFKVTLFFLFLAFQRKLRAMSRGEK